ncbi:putative UDP-glucuronate:xylan alpha-glucuronosyltransferase 4 [Euphorbia lathyris]|uniref:putative UDP-glucuronate:xylan alpha-glucuronosyltransferase 4 n=1 Tax=Euphorbia lathyris TaxID=212925 RepID=UPI003313A274
MRPQKSCLNLFVILYLFFFSLYITFLNFPFTPKPQTHPLYRLLAGKFDGRKIKIGLVNFGGDAHHHNNSNSVETVNIDFEHVSKDKKWEDFFPEWIDEDSKWGPPRCPDIPLASRRRMGEYRGLDVVVARVPCGGGGGEKRGIRDVFRLQVNLVVANLVVENGGVGSGRGDRTVYVVFVGSCGPMEEMFRCDDMVSHVGDYWLYKPDLKKLKQKILMPVGTCQIASPFAETGDESWNKAHYHRKFAYATVLHSSEAYVCGAIALAQSIIQTNSTKDLILLHDSSISPKSLRGLRSAGWKTTLIEPIRSPFARKDSYNEWNYSKLRIWQLKQYDKLIFIDSDIVVLRNLDSFFHYPQLSASGNDKVLFNSGIMVIEPSECKFNDLMSKITKLKSYNGGDQGFLNEVFTWWHRLPSKLNYLKVFRRGDDRNREISENVYAIHLLGLKPWMCYKDYDCNWDMVDRHEFASDSAHMKWWKVFDKMPKRLQKYCGLTQHMDARIRKWRKIAKKAGLPDQHWKMNVKDPRQRNIID